MRTQGQARKKRRIYLQVYRNLLKWKEWRKLNKLPLPYRQRPTLLLYLSKSLSNWNNKMNSLSIIRRLGWFNKRIMSVHHWVLNQCKRLHNHQSRRTKGILSIHHNSGNKWRQKILTPLPHNLEVMFITKRHQPFKTTPLNGMDDQLIIQLSLTQNRWIGINNTIVLPNGKKKRNKRSSWLEQETLE